MGTDECVDTTRWCFRQDALKVFAIIPVRNEETLSFRQHSVLELKFYDPINLVLARKLSQILIHFWRCFTTLYACLNAFLDKTNSMFGGNM